MNNQIEIILVGDSFVGKTSLFCRYFEKEFKDISLPTIGIDYELKYFLNDKIKYMIKVCDTAGQEKFDSLTKSYYRKADAAVIVYDLNKKVTFENIKKWYDKVVNNCDGLNIVIAVVGNKLDIYSSLSDSKRQLASDEIKNINKYMDIQINMTTSAKTNKYIGELFEQIILKVIEKRKKPNMINRNIINSILGLELYDAEEFQKLRKLNDERHNKNCYC